MRQKYHQGKYTIKNPQKYSGKGEPTFRSSWEFTFMNFCDDNPSVVAWASEPCKITYQNPLNGKVTAYVPDFVIVYEDKDKNRKAEFIEIKPAGQTLAQARSPVQKAQAIINEAKWQAAKVFAKRQGVGFRVLTENELFNNHKKRRRK